VEFLTNAQFRSLSNPGVTSVQLISPHNSSSARVTITRVTVAAGAVQPRHQHESSEQIWLALSGGGTLLLAGEGRKTFVQGDVVRFEEGDVHGFENTSAEPFVYLSVTSPPINFSHAYRSET
jgi:quercetin dioxygenase-like cupin family protein